MRLIITEEEKNKIKQMHGLLNEQSETPTCGNGGCSGKYVGPEFDRNGDVAHKYSNTITQSVATKLKELYKAGIYVKVDFNNIKMTTKGMGSGNVVYTVNIPFVSVSDKCDARTGFAHVGGWNHSPELNARKSEILNFIPQGKSENIVLNNELDVSKLTRTQEGLQEYWIQWRHKDYQGDCGSNVVNQNQSEKTQSSDNVGGSVMVDSIPLQINAFNILSKRLQDWTKNQSDDDRTFTVGNFELNFDKSKNEISYKIVGKPNGQKFTKLVLAINDEAKKTQESKGYYLIKSGNIQLPGEFKSSKPNGYSWYLFGELFK